MGTTGDRLRDPRKRAERAERILAVATDLLLRFGYRRVTIDDVARQADIGKGTIYLHWKTRDDLFRAVFEREVLAAIEELLDTLRRDPGTWRPHRLASCYFLAIMSRPLLRAFFLADSEVLGKLVSPTNRAREARHGVLSQAYFELLSAHGVLRDDLNADQLAYAFLATLEGFIHSEAATHRTAGSDIQARADLLALTVERAFETSRRLSRSAENTIAEHVIDLITHLSVADRAERRRLSRPRRRTRAQLYRIAASPDNQEAVTMAEERKRDPVRTLSNRIFLTISGRWFRAYSIVRHVGRRSGREYHNPVSAYPLGDRFVIPVLYGAESNWVRTVIAAGRFILRTKGRDYVLERPEIITPARALPAYPPLSRRMMRSRNIQDFVWGHKADPH